MTIEELFSAVKKRGYFVDAHDHEFYRQIFSRTKTNVDVHAGYKCLKYDVTVDTDSVTPVIFAWAEFIPMDAEGNENSTGYEPQSRCLEVGEDYSVLLDWLDKFIPTLTPKDIVRYRVVFEVDLGPFDSIDVFTDTVMDEMEEDMILVSVDKI